MGTFFCSKFFFFFALLMIQRLKERIKRGNMDFLVVFLLCPYFLCF